MFDNELEGVSEDVSSGSCRGRGRGATYLTFGVPSGVIFSLTGLYIQGYVYENKEGCIYGEYKGGGLP